ncbi:ATP-binding protein [Clostridium sp. KNHs216]|uniref:HAMP domain-containing sensor histidine kinase n=1 Tax=Clostridium sp. KNHs216 TaxID=1550235 RepID=UPI001152F01F|nr:ATP-binding protein [Clostridium sp. KNHs216]TQI68846.1 two-component system phosphate regulon sensor histidine kinase PhoR [Clostridium sp. KNHs216]
MKRKLMLSNAVIIVLGFIAAFLLAALQIQRQYQTEFTRRLDTALSILSTQLEEIERDPETAATNVGVELEKTGQEMRISIIGLDGKVTGDSAREEINQNHSSRPEILQARKNGRGYDTRISASLNQRYYYEAVYIKDRFFIRAALPTADLDRVLYRLWMVAALSMLLGIAIVCVVTGVLVYRTTEPLKQLTDAAREISGGDYSSRVTGSYKDEVGELARSFNMMAQSTETAVSQLVSKQNQLEGVLQGMDDGVLAVNAENEILFLNQSARRLLEKQSLAEKGKLEGSLLIGKIANMMKRAIENSSAGKETVLGGPNEKQFTVYVSPIAGPQEQSALAVITDVTRMHKLEQMRSEFVANVTHELKTPLTSIRGSIELLKSADRDEETRRYFYDVLDIEAERLHRLIDDMLALSQIENAKEDPSMRRCSVRNELEQCIERLEPLAEKSRISLTLDADSTLFVACSPTRLQQMFGNLIENGIKYNRSGGSVSVTARRQRQMAIIRVKDTGIGIAPEHFDRLFERFYRVDASRSREIGGTGLGLSIVKHLAALYGGEVGVESEVGKGSTFIVRLPLALNEG